MVINIFKLRLQPFSSVVVSDYLGVRKKHHYTYERKGLIDI